MISNLSEMTLNQITELDRICLENFEKMKQEDKESFANLADVHGVSGTSQLDTYGAFTTWLHERARLYFCGCRKSNSVESG